LSRRQRIAIARCACSRQAQARRQGHCVAASQLREQELWLDGFNVLTAVETALGGGVILVGRDGCCRDVAGIYSHYRKVEETVPALQAIGRMTSQWGVAQWVFGKGVIPLMNIVCRTPATVDITSLAARCMAESLSAG
jgi:hypothetical protein